MALKEDRGSSSLKKSTFVGENVEMKVSVMKVCSRGMQGTEISFIYVLILMRLRAVLDIL